MEPIRIGKTEHNGTEVVVVELFGVTLAHSHTMVESYDTESDFVDYWSKYFMQRIVSQLVEQMHADRGVRGWALPTKLASKPPSLPRGEGWG